jgi:regulatory protein
MNGIITGIKAGKNPRIKRSNVFLDGKFAFSLDTEVIFKQGLKVGQELSIGQIEGLTVSDRFQSCFNAALQFLSYRARSESETRTRLQKRGYEGTEIEKTIEQLKQTHLLDDAAFAEYWKENRNSFRPRSQRMLNLELRRKGLAGEIIKEATADVDETGNAYRAATAKARTITGTDYQVFRQKLGGFLQRRGFGYGVISKTVKQVWLERTGELSETEDPDS